MRKKESIVAAVLLHLAECSHESRARTMFVQNLYTIAHDYSPQRQTFGVPIKKEENLTPLHVPFKSPPSRKTCLHFLRVTVIARRRNTTPPIAPASICIRPSVRPSVAWRGSRKYTRKCTSRGTDPDGRAGQTQRYCLYSKEVCVTRNF